MRRAMAHAWPNAKMELIRGILPVVLLFGHGAVANAKESPAVSIGGGVYMMTDRNISIFGSSDAIVMKLMARANSFCHERHEGGAELLGSDGSNAEPGVFNDNGTLRRPAKGATGTVRFKCDSVASPEVKSNTPESSLPQAYFDRVDALRTQVLEGRLSVTKGFLSPQVSPSFVVLSANEAAMVEGRSTWWKEEGAQWFVHIQNVTPSDIEAFELSINSGVCAPTNLLAKKFIVQLASPIRAGDLAVVKFQEPDETYRSAQPICSVVTTLWGSRH